MSNFAPKTPIELQIRKIIFENFNDVDSKFSNDEIFEIIKNSNFSIKFLIVSESIINTLWYSFIFTFKSKK